ncbi:1,2-phenylacetyl-CoA epoxidase subunit PaaE [Marinitenerispora sediminis]|uniref:Phenylacetate-CoA oxygenase/reductase subunit PaaK n=1 Tax=Marinitenerispora sediminis TaxID=1931232 RepID=A0A368TBY4_9ACTN|nr:1,2-phenylacetyl-CoA epoxidase subunit PaaE [Marinitenerispora sediminis]RCV50416.1 phenylacetate-CoA oxygenase/reductase subunit PaaK [Marinitenerispora sediminis]RCV55304.1 phenylacetate-CoA oxygenase/reductase subunit PaaK [Marinitenerispora sediminis]RCV62486.1 phenylacetate-CoA oxygenase/reductase subunit PaaK [Marinitenerispora sediminis]
MRRSAAGLPAAANPTAPARARRRAFHTLRVAAVDRLCADAAAVTFDVPEGLAASYAFAPGQSVTLRRVVEGREERRSYSVCAPAGAPLRIGVRRVADGLFSSWLVDRVRPGDGIEVLPPSGRFVPDLRTAARHVLIGAGSGITPLLSIAASLLRDTGSDVALVYGNRRTDTVMFADELADLKDRYGPRLELVHVLSREPREADLLTGRLDAAKIEALLATLIAAEEVDHWWLCGPHGMVRDARRVLAARGVPAARVHQELFFVEDAPPPARRPAEGAPAGPTSEVTVLLDGRSTTLTLPRDVPVLDSAQAVRSDLPFACRGGVCGTCRARVVAGRVEMRRNYALQDDELAAGFVLTCQSLPATGEVTLDFDA